jgi:hypothetical protein
MRERPGRRLDGEVLIETTASAMAVPSDRKYNSEWRWNTDGEQGERCTAHREDVCEVEVEFDEGTIACRLARKKAVVFRTKRMEVPAAALRGNG